MELLLLIIAIIGLYFWIKSQPKDKLSTYLTDHYMKIDYPVPICGTPDVVWRDKAGRLIVGDYKSRTNGQVYESDIIQLSVYKVLLEYTLRRTVTSYGYIHFRDGRRTRVNLLSEKEVINLYRRYQDIIFGYTKSQSVNRKRYCQYCRYLGTC